MVNFPTIEFPQNRPPNRKSEILLRFRDFERLFSIACLVQLSNAITPLLLSGGSYEGDGLDIATIDLSLHAKISTLCYLIAIAMLVLRWKRTVNMVLQSSVLTALLSITAASYFWSVNPGQTLMSTGYTIGATAIGMYLAQRWTLKEILEITGQTFGLLLILSIIFAVLMPKFGIMSGVHEGAFRGVFMHKNQFGGIMGFSSAVFFLNAIKSAPRRWIYWAYLMLSTATIVLSRSSTALSFFVLTFILCLVFRIFRWKFTQLVTAFLTTAVVGGTALVYALFSQGYSSFFELFGKDATMSGRTDIWKYSYLEVLEKPLLGHGFTAFWSTGFNLGAGEVQRAMHIEVIYAHNGFLDILLSLGFVGLTVFVFFLLLNAWRSLRSLSINNSPEYFFPLLFLTYLILSNITEGSIEYFNNMFWVILVSLYYSLKEN